MSATPQKSAETETSQGRYEVAPQQFTDTLKDEPKENIQQFDLKAAFPDELAATTRLPKLAEKVWRRVLDENIAEFGGAYCPVKNSTFVQIWFENIPSGAAKAKLPTIASRMSAVFKKARDDKENPDAAFEAQFVSAKEKDTRAAPQMSPELARLMQQGLTPNPPVGLLDVWMTRTTQAILHGNPPTPFAKEVMEVVAKADLAYMPVWTCANELLVGSFSQVKSPVPAAQYTPAEPMRQDLIALFAICFQLTALATKNIQSLGFVSLRLPILSNKLAMDLINAFMLRVNPGVKKNLIIEIRALQPGSLSPAIKKMLEALSQHCKAFMVDTGAFSKEDYKNDFPKLHACGFDIGGTNLPEVEIISLIRKYAETYKARPQKTYLKGVNTPHIIKAAKECGFMYLQGPAVHAAEKFCTSVRQFPIRL